MRNGPWPQRMYYIYFCYIFQQHNQPSEFERNHVRVENRRKSDLLNLESSPVLSKCKIKLIQYFKQ